MCLIVELISRHWNVFDMSYPDEASSRFDKEQTKLQNERDLLRGVRQKERDVMSDLISTNERIVEEIDQLKMFKEEAELKCEQEKIASGVLAQHIVDLELELEQQRKKYHEATTALAEMENVLMVREGVPLCTSQ